MNPTDSDIAARYIHGILEGTRGIVRLKCLLNGILEDDSGNESCWYIGRRCRNATHLEDWLKDHSHLFVVENGRVARYCKELDSGRENADRYFRDILKLYDLTVNFMDLRSHTEEAPNDIKKFIQYFYPDKEFKRYLQHRPHIFFVRCDGDVCLVEMESVRFFQRTLKQARGSMRVTSLRGRVGQAPAHIRTFVNHQYPGNQLYQLLQNHANSFRVDKSGWVHLVR